MQTTYDFPAQRDDVVNVVHYSGFLGSPCGFKVNLPDFASLLLAKPFRNPLCKVLLALVGVFNDFVRIFSRPFSMGLAMIFASVAFPVLNLDASAAFRNSLNGPV